ncbi:Pre-mRNA-splicing factor cwf19 [Linderina pennispora]|nr:Pre-mRNA-splicing factor cwf19 [Linderina pennispora]
MKAKLRKSADLPELERQLAEALAGETKSSTGCSTEKDNVVVLPRTDSSGRLLNLAADTGSEDSMSIKQMARAERENDDDPADRLLAKQIVGDSGFSNDLEYMDENIEKFTKQAKGKSAEQKRQAAIHDYNLMEAAINACELCFKQSSQSDGSTLLTPPQFPIIALGTRVYLALPNREPMNDGHCVIAPIEHSSGSSLKLDDDTWDEIGNFMKCLMRMFMERRMGVVFLETVMSTTKSTHCVIECVPIPFKHMDDVHVVFQQGILGISDEWSQHRKVIDTSLKAQAVRPENDNVTDQDQNHEAARAAIRRGGFRNTMTAKMPYFHVWFDPKGGLGHVIESPETFPPWFGREVVAGILDLPPSVYRKPRRLRESRDQRLQRADEWKKQFGWDKYDWTKVLE